MTDSNHWQGDTNDPNGLNDSGKPDEPDVTGRLIDLIRNLPEDKQAQLLSLLSKWDYTRKRKHARKSCLLAVDYSTPDRFYREFIQNISAGGIYIETREPLKKGEDISLTFSIPSSDVPIRLTGKIVRTDKSGIAVGFENMTKYQEEIISTLLDKL